MVRLYVNVQFKVKPLSTGTSSSRTKKKIVLNSFTQGVFQMCSQVLALQDLTLTKKPRGCKQPPPPAKGVRGFCRSSLRRFALPTELRRD